MFIGYPKNYSLDTIKAIYMDTWRETKTRDIEWMDMTYRDWKHQKHREEHLGSEYTRETSKTSKETEESKPSDK